MDSARIMIVEDEGIVAMDLEHRLKNLGHEVAAVASSGEEAIRKAAAVQPQLVLMDIRLKGRMDGIETARAIQDVVKAPIVYLTAHADDSTVERAKMTEPHAYLLKPFKEVDLRVAIEMALYKHEMEQKLWESRQWLSTTLNSIADAVIATDKNGRVVFINPVAARLTGWQQEEARGRDEDEIFNIIDGASRAVIESPVRKVLKERAISTLTSNKILISKDRRETPIGDSAAPLLDENGEMIGVVMVFRDITEQKLAQETLRAKEEQLRQMQKMEAVGRLAGGIAHDFNNMLTAILGYSSLLEIDAGGNEFLLSSVREIKKAGERSASLTQQLLAFSRKQMLQPKVFDLNTVVADMDKMLRRLFGENIELVTVPDSSPCTVKADPGQIGQVIMNLAINAKHAMPKGGKLFVKTQKSDIEEGQEAAPSVAAGRYVVLVVADTGCGMDEETKAHIFEPFFTTKDIGMGTGLGLATVYGIIKQSGGDITFSSQLGVGTTFNIFLPTAREASVAQFDQDDLLYLPRGTETVLLVEDEAAVRDLEHLILSEQGYRVLTATNGEEALRVASQHEGHIDLLLTDVVMPQMGGTELAERLRRLRPDLKILFTSGYTEDAIFQNAGPDPEMAFIPKPFQPSEFARKVRDTLGESVRPEGSMDEK